MQLTIFLDGKTYISQKTEEDYDDIAEKFYNLEKPDKLKIELADGSILVLFKDAVVRAHLLFEA